MRMPVRNVAAIAVLILFSSASAHAFHPLITDDTGTQGRGEHRDGTRLQVRA